MQSKAPGVAKAIVLIGASLGFGERWAATRRGKVTPSTSARRLDRLAALDELRRVPSRPGADAGRHASRRSARHRRPDTTRARPHRCTHQQDWRHAAVAAGRTEGREVEPYAGYPRVRRSARHCHCSANHADAMPQAHRRYHLGWYASGVAPPPLIAPAISGAPSPTDCIRRRRRSGGLWSTRARSSSNWPVTSPTTPRARPCATVQT